MRKTFTKSRFASFLVAISTSALSASLLASVTFAADAAQPLWVEVNKAGRKAPVAIPSIAPLINTTEPAVLVISTTSSWSDMEMPPGHPKLDGFPKVPGFMPDAVGQGAGFIIHPSGYALTNHHVIENAKTIRVRVGDAPEQIDAVVVGSDEKTDIALIKLVSTRTDWPVIPLGDSDALQIGDFVVAIGSPFGLEQSASLGIVSARGRRDIAPSGRQGLYDFLQTDAAINPGNSGGPLINLNGEAIGINSAVNAAGQGIGFAIPINMVKRLAPELKEKGRFARSWLGVSIQEVTTEMLSAFGMSKPEGAIVREVVPDGPAAKAGVKAGDVIVVFDGKPIPTSSSLPLLASEAGVGRRVSIDVIRNQKHMPIQITLEEHPDSLAAMAARKAKEAAKNDDKVGKDGKDGKETSKSGATDKSDKADKSDKSGTTGKTGKADEKSDKPDKKEPNLGMSVATIDEDVRAKAKLPKDAKGVHVVKVQPGSAASEAGLAPDDVITLVNDIAVNTAADFARIVKETPSHQPLRILVKRANAEVFMVMIKP